MEFTQVVTGFGALLVSGFGVVLWTLFTGVRNDLQSVQRELAAHKVYVAETYVTHVALRQTMNDFESKIGQVLEAINKSSDQMRGDVRDAFSDLNRRIDTKADRE